MSVDEGCTVCAETDLVPCECRCAVCGHEAPEDLRLVDGPWGFDRRYLCSSCIAPCGDHGRDLEGYPACCPECYAEERSAWVERWMGD